MTTPRQAAGASGGAGARRPSGGAPGAVATAVPTAVTTRAPNHKELWWALATIVLVTGLYTWAYLSQRAFPDASSLIGHGIGILGFVLMLMTATLYTIRKRVTDSRWGAVASWLKFHMYTGLVGPWMVLLHTSMKFQGVAALAMGLTVVVVISGIVGRFLYTRVPRMANGGLLATTGLEAARARDEIVSRRRVLATWHTIHVPLTWALFVAAFIHVVAALYYATLQR